MGSFKGNGRGEGSNRRTDDARRRRQGRLDLESLEERRLLSGPQAIVPPTWHPTDNNPFDVQHGPLANLGKDAIQSYRDYLNYEQAGAHGAFQPSLGKQIAFRNTSIGIDVRGYGDFNTYKSALTSLGMTITATVPKYDLIEGFFPLQNLPQLASEGQTVGGQPIYRPKALQAGLSPNQSDVGENAAAARTAFNVTGAGQKVGVLSTSVNEFGGGVAASVATGDLPPEGVQIIQDYPAGGYPAFMSDEGRAMLEQVHDIAPGASLAFATAFTGEAGFATNIQALYDAGARTIVDDAGYFLDPFYQDGIIQQSINNVVAGGAVYLSSAGNESDSGYQSQFRPVSATVGALGAGTYMNFDPTGATTTTQIGINEYSPGGIVLQFDQPFYTTNGVTSIVELDVLDQSGNLVAQANSNNVAMQSPTQITGTLPVGLYNVVIKVDSGPAPNHIVFYATGDSGFSVDSKFGAAGGTFYPSITGHSSGAETISVGAVPFWGTPGFVHTPAIDTSESFSSTGPSLKVFNPDGSPMAAPVLLNKPDLSAPDGNNTTFFGPGQFANTTAVTFPATPPFPGDPVTTFSEPTTAANQSVATLPNFFGTSSAAPNLAAVVALMKQSNPTLTRDQILGDLISTTTPLNNVPKGTWGPQGGYGLANAFAALTAAQTFQVNFISPGANQTIASVPPVITVAFSQPVNLATIVPANLVVTAPNGATVTVGKPFGVDNPIFPTIVAFPISITPAPGKLANGTYFDAFVPGAVVSQKGLPLTGTVFDRFNLQQTQGPRVVSTSFVGRIVNLTFNEAINPASINAGDLFLFRTNGVSNPVFTPGNIIVSQLPGAVFTYDPATFTATIDLTAVPQSFLPTDHYGLVGLNSITDAVGNPLNGAFSGVFPSGTTPPVFNGTNFFQDLGVVQVQPPLISALTLAPNSDSGLPGDNNTNISTPSLVGQVTAKFPGAVAGLLVYAEFNGIAHPGLPLGSLDLGVGANGRGFVGRFDVTTTTDALGRFTIVYPPGVSPLPEGENRVRVVVVGQPDQPPFPGFSSSQDLAFRIDRTDPYVGSLPGAGPATSIPEGANINNLATLTLNIIDPVNPQTIGNPFAVDPKFGVPALNPVLASNVQNYRLFRLTGAGTSVDESSFITSATFVSTSARVLSSDPYTGQVVLTFAPGLPAGQYQFFALSSVVGSGLTDAAGNPFAGYAANSAANNPVHFLLDFNLQPTPTYVTNYAALTPNAASSIGFDVTGPRANYELPVSGLTPRAEAPPTEFMIDFSNPLNPATNFNNAVQLVRSADTVNGKPDGNFGDLGITNTSGYTRVTGVTVTLGNSVPGAVFGQYGFNNRLLIQLPPGLTLPADYYRVYLANTGASPITDVYGNQLDGEFLGYQNAFGKYVDNLQTGQVRGNGPTELPDLSGDGTPGGAFMTGFVVVPNGNIIFARADALFNPQIPGEIPNGSAALPYPVLAPEAIPNAVNGGDLNSIVNSGTNFNSTYDRSGDGQFQPSAFFAAQQRVQATGGPVVIIAEQSVPARDLNTGAIVKKPFVLEAPSPSGLQIATIANDASAAVPAMTTLILDQGSILKMQNAALLIQNQGSAFQVLGGPNSFQTVTVTSYKDATVGGVSNGDPTSVPSPGDYGGIVFRNFSQAALPGQTAARTTLFPGQIALTNDPLIDQRLKGPFADPSNPDSQVDAISGADDVMSFVNFLTEKYAGGAVPVTVGVRYDGITMLNSRPAIVNTTIANSGGAGSAQAGLSVDVDSLRADDVATGPLIRNDQFINDGLNGIYIRAQVSSGIAEPTDAIAYPTNPSARGGSANYVLDDPYPYLLTSRLVIGTQLIQESGGGQTFPSDRLYVDPGMMIKFELGAGVMVQDSGSLNVGDQTYIKHYDADNTYGPTFAARLPNGQPNPQAGQVNPNFVTNSPGLAHVLFTSLNDDTASTSYFDPITQITTTVVAPLPAVPGGSGALQPTPGHVPDPARWGGFLLRSSTIDVINSADFRYGGGVINTPGGSGTQHVLEINPEDGIGSHVMITNNVFNDNLDVPINLSPNAIEAGDPQRPLLSGDPFLHGNVFQRNGLNGVGVQGGTGNVNTSNLETNSVWTGGDYAYILRDTIVLGGGLLPVPTSTAQVAEPRPIVALTLQSTLPGTILADGETVAAPGIPLIVKLGDGASVPGGGPLPPTETSGANPTAAIPNSFRGGAGFLVGVDNGIDPTADSLIDPGAFSQLRIVGIPGNQTTGQTRIPVVITSIHDSSVGTTVNNVPLFQVIPGDTTAPKAGDGGVIYFGANSLTDYNLLDPRDGNIIDNADIRFITRIEQQGGGIIYGFDTTGANAGLTPSYPLKLGQSLPGGVGFAAQYNQPKSLTISNSNLSAFSDVGFRATPGYAPIVVPVNYPSPIGRSGAITGEPTHTFFVNDTISNMPNGGVEIISQSASDFFVPGPFPSPMEAVFLNDTFNNDNTAIHTFAPAFAPFNYASSNAILAMDDIFSNNATVAVQTDGQHYGSEIQYSLFSANAADTAGGIANNQPIVGNPQFRDAANGNYQLLPNSAAIDRARSELGPSIFGDMLYPAVSFQTNPITGQLDPSLPSIRNQIGDTNPLGGTPINFFSPFPVDNVTLPGETVTQRGFPDEWIPVLRTSGQGSGSTAANAATYFYTPLSGERDQAGNLRVKDPNSPNVGFGSRPFFDLGAFEFIIQNPPVVDAVVSVTNTLVTNIYGVGTIAGTNMLPQSIQIKFNERLDPKTINGSDVVLLASGGDGIFGNGNSPTDRIISLAGKLSFNPNTDILTIDTSGIFTSTLTANDEFRLILKGTGSSVIRDLNGLALDGLNLDANGNQLPLPSGSDMFPGSDFQVTFTIDTSPPSVVAGSFTLDPISNTGGNFKNITKFNQPTFDGTITDIFPPTNFLQGQTVHIDISTRGDGNFDLLDAGVGTTDAAGHFRITLTTPIPDTPQPIYGPDGIQGDPGSVFTLARVRVVDQAGNVSNLPTDPIQSYIAKGAETFLQVDTKLPRLTNFAPLGNTVATVQPNGVVVFTAAFDENIKPSSVNPSSVLVFRTGGTGKFTTPVAVPIIPGSFVASFSTDPASLGFEMISFAVAAPLPNDQYEVIIKGTGTNPVTDIAGNPINGAFNGTFPTGFTGATTGSDFTSLPVVVFQPSSAHLIYVEAPPTFGSGTLGTRENPFPTIAAGMNAALIGDDVLVLPGVYKEDVSIKPGVRLLSASLSSTDTTFLPGSPFETLIYGVPLTGTILNPGGGNTVTVSVIGATPGIPTEISGFSIVSPLVGDPVSGFIDQTSIGILAVNSDIQIDRNNVVNAGLGVSLVTSGNNAQTSTVFDNVIAGNVNGIGITDQGSTVNIVKPFQIVNNTIADNSVGLYNSATSEAAGTFQAFVQNNIFYSNHDLTFARNGTGIDSLSPNTLAVGTNLFYQNGPNNLPASNAIGSFVFSPGVAFVPSALTTSPDILGNFIGNPFFANPEDPRPNGDTPAVFFNFANFDLTSRSPAINAANNQVAPQSDFLYRTPVHITGHGFANTGPASIGAYYFGGIASTTIGGTGTIFGGTGSTTGSTTGTGGTTLNGLVSAKSLVQSPIGAGIALGTKQFSVLTTSLSNEGTVHASDAVGGIVTEAGPTFIDVNFSDNIKPSTLTPTDLVLSGSGLDPANPARSTSLAWIDDHAVRFFLSGGYNKSGTVNVSIPQGAATDTQGAALVGFSDSFQLPSVVLPSPASPVSSTPIVSAASLLPVVQPIAAAAPIVIPTATAHATKNSKSKAHHAAPAKETKQQHAPAKAAHHQAPAKPAHHQAPAKPAKATPKAKKGK
jgi:hypothetical protein